VTALVVTEAGAAATSAELGGKGANLFELVRIGQPVPPFCVLTTSAFRRALEKSGLTTRIAQRLAVAGADERALSEAGREIRTWVEAVELEPELRSALARAHGQLGFAEAPVAVRSSAAGEDSGGQSFAGMHDSFLFVRGLAAVEAALKRVWASAWNERALAYRRGRGLALDDIAVAVVVQRMIDAEKSGVLFTCDPSTGNVQQVVVSALWGAGEGLVSAGLDADTFTVEKRDLSVAAVVTRKTERMVRREGADGLERVSLPEALRLQASLSDDEVRRVASAGLAIERHHGRPQDVEFCFDAAGELFVVQARPVTNVEEYGPAAGNRVTWDNSNIIESYSGVTTPMTFSFIRRAYTIVYHCFAEVMGIGPAVVKAHERTFENMLGLFRGRVYYNLASWYGVVRLFPGYAFNRRAMESMMGVKEPLEDGPEPPPPSFARRWFVELPALLRLVARSLWNFARIQKLSDGFLGDFRRHYERWDAMDFEERAPHELRALYREMEDALLWNWKAPIVNDFYVMVYFGLLKKLCASWCGDASGSLQNDLLSGEGGVESAEPARWLLRLAREAQGVPELRAAILERELETLPELVRAEPRWAAFAGGVERYLELYGFRCMNELMLEELSLRDRPHLVYQVLRNYLRLDDPAALDVAAMAQREQRLRQDAESRARAGLRERRALFPRGLVFRHVLRCARRGVKNRENMRFARTRIYGLVRELLRAFGKRLAAEGVLADAEDVFYLTIQELWDFVGGTAVSTDLAGLVRVRRAEFARYRSGELARPADRFETFGMAYHKNRFLAARTDDDADPTADGTLRGIGCAPGVVEAKVRVLGSPSDDLSLNKEILVAERTDPGWVPLYPSVSGILIERGSPLSHSAVVAREMGIPTIVGIVGLLQAVSDGDVVRMDGAAGTVEPLAAAEQGGA